MNELRAVHCIGVNGIGVSAIAHHLACHGVSISGSDLHLPPEGTLPSGEYWEGHDPTRIHRAIDAVVYSPAVPENDPERVAARELGIKEFSYPEMLGVLSRAHETIAISGTHGKSTTTALTALFFTEALLDPTVIVGAVVPEWHMNYRKGESGLLIVEACEYRAHMLELTPRAIVLTNLELDHPDFYRDIEHTQEVFGTYIEKLKKEDLLVVNGDDIHLSAILDRTDAQIVRYGTTTATMDLHGAITEVTPQGQKFTLVWRGEKLGEFHTKLPGKYNIMNILAATAVMLAYKKDPGAIKRVLERFTGVGRRFEVVGKYRGADVVSDYAHHPTALREVVKAASERYPDKKVITVFRPHHQERTKRLYKEFVNTFANIPHLIALEIYDVAGRESDDAISTEQLVKDVRAMHPDQTIQFASDIASAEAKVAALATDQTVILVVGAGDADQLAKDLVNMHE